MGIFGGDLQRLGVALRGSIADDIDRVVVTPGSRENGVVRLGGLRAEFRQFTAAHNQGIGGQHAGTAGVRHDGEARTLGTGLLGQNFGHVEQVGDIVDAQYAAAAESGFQHFIAAGERPGMGSGCLGGGGGASGLDHDNRLAESYFARGGQEATSIADRFHVDHDRLGADIVAQVVDQVAPAYVHHGPDGHEGAEAHHLFQAPIQDRGAERAALADEADRTGPRDGGSEGGVHAGKGAHHSQAVGADDADVRSLRLLQKLPLKLGAFRTDLLEPGGNHDGPAHTLLAAFPDQTRNRRRRSDDYGQVDGLGNVRDRLVGFHAQNTGAFGIHGIDRPAERARDQVPKHGPSYAVRGLGGADDRDRLG